jgi:hypothetical protein
MTGRASLRKVKDFRNEALAHIRTDALLQNLPLYGEVFRLLGVAKVVVGRAMLAVLGRNDTFEEVETRATEEAIAFWRPALAAAHQATRWDRPIES